jgi:hypothetical protein
MREYETSVTDLEMTLKRTVAVLRTCLMACACGKAKKTQALYEFR